MGLDNAIKHLEEILSDPNHEWSCEECKKEHEDLLRYLEELKAYRKLFDSPEEANELLDQIGGL